MGAQTAGIKIAQPGFDARTCPDYELIFNSSWPTLAIAIDQTVNITTDATGAYTFTHNLGFPCLAMAWVVSGNTTNGRTFPNITSTQLLFSGLTGQTLLSPNTAYTINVKCYNLDISIPQSYDYLQSAAIAQAYDPNYGIKITKQNKNINSKDLRDFILHSRAASPMVLAIVTEHSATVSSASLSILNYTNPQNYVPWAFGYVEQTSAGVTSYVFAPIANQAYPTFSYSSVSVRMSLITNGGGGYTGKGSLIILRDPLFVSSEVEVTY